MVRDGVYLLPRTEERQRALLELADAIVEAEGSAQVIEHGSRDRRWRIGVAVRVPRGARAAAAGD